MSKFNPNECAQAALVFNQLLLSVTNGDPEALTHFCADPASSLRKLVAAPFIREEMPPAAKKAEVPMLRPLTTRGFPAIARFSSTASFGRDNALGIKFILGPHFLANFFGMVEGNVPARDLAVGTLTRKATNIDIRKELGGREEIFLAHFHHALVGHGTGQRDDAFLVADGEQNIGFIRDKNGMLCSVYARLMDGNVWDIEAPPLSDQAPWGPNSQVLYNR